MFTQFTCLDTLLPGLIKDKLYAYALARKKTSLHAICQVQNCCGYWVTLLREDEDDDESVKTIFYLYFTPHVTFSSHFLHAITFLHVLHLDILKSQIETETEK